MRSTPPPFSSASAAASARGRYDRSRGFRGPALPAMPPAVRARRDVERDRERLDAALRTLFDEQSFVPSRDAAPGKAPNTPRQTHDSFDEAIAAANALSDVLCEWNAAAVAAADSRGGASSSSAATAAAEQ